MDMETRQGRQSPTRSVILPYTDTKGERAVTGYNRSGRKALPWQIMQIYDIMAVNDEGKWLHMKYGYSVPRRNGKSEILIMRAIDGLRNGERVLYTAHRTTTSHNAWEKICVMLGKMGFVENQDYKSVKQFGLERIEWLRGEVRGVINFRTRSAKGGLGEGYDLLIIDEAQEYTADQESALKYVVTDSKNPQTLMCGTPPTAVSSGTVFPKFRTLTLSGNNINAGWAEWSVPQLSNAHDPELWYETNPSLGTVLSERAIRSELGDDQTDDNIQRLGLWIMYNLHSAISKKEWESFKLTEKPQLKDPVKLFFGVKFAKSSGNVSLAVACKTSDGKIFVEAVDCRPVREGNGWLLLYLRNPHAEGVVIDGANGAPILAGDMKENRITKTPVLPKVREVIEANALFEQQLFLGNISHFGQPSLEQAATNCEHRAIGSDGGFGYESVLEGADISLLEAVTLAHWLCFMKKEKKVQKVHYY